MTDADESIVVLEEEMMGMGDDDSDDDVMLESDPGDFNILDEQDGGGAAKPEPRDIDDTVAVSLTLDSDSEDNAHTAVKSEQQRIVETEETTERNQKKEEQDEDEPLVDPKDEDVFSGLDIFSTLPMESVQADADAVDQQEETAADDTQGEDTPQPISEAAKKEMEEEVAGYSSHSDVEILALNKKAEKERKERRRERRKRHHTPEEELNFDMSDDEEIPKKRKSRKSKKSMDTPTQKTNKSNGKKDKSKKGKGKGAKTVKKPAVKEPKSEPAMINMPNHPRKPQTGYQLFSTEKRPFVVEELKATSGKAPSPSEVMKTLGSMWRELVEDEKETFLKIAIEDKKRYNLEMEIYKETDEYKRACELGGGKKGSKLSPVKAAVISQPEPIVRKVVQNTVLACNDYLSKFDINIIPNSTDRARVQGYFDRLAPLRAASSTQEMTRRLLRRMEHALVRKLQSLTSRIEAHKKEVARRKKMEAEASQQTVTSQDETIGEKSEIATQETIISQPAEDAAVDLKAFIAEANAGTQTQQQQPKKSQRVPPNTPRKSYAATINESTEIGVSDGLSISRKFEIDIGDDL